MRYDLTDFEWSVIEPLLPRKRRGVKPKKNRRVLNGIFWVLRTGAPWRDMPERYGPYTTAYNRFNRWRKAGIWDRLMDAIVKAHDGNVQMIDSSIVRVHQHASGVEKKWRSLCGRSSGGLTTKIHARVDAQGRPVQLLISPGNDHDVAHAEPLLEGIEHGAVVIADKGYDADGVRACIRDHGAIPNIPNRSNRKTKFRWKKAIYRQRNHVERFFNKLKQFRRVATRYDKLGANFFAFVKLASVRIWLRSIEFHGLVPSSPAPCEEVALGALEPGGADGVARATAMMSCSVSAPCACAHLRRSRVGPYTMAYEFDGGDGGGEGFPQLPPSRYGVGSDAVMGMGRQVD